MRTFLLLTIFWLPHDCWDWSCYDICSSACPSPPAKSPVMSCIIVLSLCHQDQNCHIKCNEDGLTQSGSLHHRQIVMSCLTISTLLLRRRGSTAGRYFTLFYSVNISYKILFTFLLLISAQCIDNGINSPAIISFNSIISLCNVALIQLLHLLPSLTDI